MKHVDRGVETKLTSRHIPGRQRMQNAVDTFLGKADPISIWYASHSRPENCAAPNTEEELLVSSSCTRLDKD